MKLKLIFSILVCQLLVLLSCGQTALKKNQNTTTQNSPNAKDSCDGPDAAIDCCFRNMPESLNSIMNIANDKEPGERMIITGTVYKEDGVTPYQAVIIYAYHTDNTGIYSKKGNEKGIQKWHGHLHGWCSTDANGHYKIHSIRPAGYPGNTAPAHIHSAIKEPHGSEPYYINDFVFKDDPLINDNYTENLNLSGGTGVVDLKKNNEGIWIGERKLVLTN